jgi:hypothetical protein
MSKLCFVHIVSSKNVGDDSSSPYHYFQDFFSSSASCRVSIADERRLSEIPIGSPIILGGGGLFANKENWDRVFTTLLDRSPFVAAWGVGRNRSIRAYRGNRSWLPSFAPRFSMLGLRDAPWSDELVPCVSCMATGFDVLHGRSPVRKFGFYLHKDRSAFVPDSISGLLSSENYLTNEGSYKDLNSSLDFISGCEFLFTNSYHGAYWATLLNVRVMIFDVFSEKFELMPWPHPKFDHGIDWPLILQETLVFPDALQRARSANLNFKSKIESALRELGMYWN